MLKNKVFIVIGAIFLSLIIVHNIKFFSQRTRERGYPLPGEAEEKEEMVEIVESQPHGEVLSPPEEREPLSPLWGRNPFLLPGEEKLGRSFLLTSSSEKEEAASVVQEKRGEEEWSLTAIIYHETSSRAIINHETVQEGDTLSGEETKVIKIMPDRVILSREGETSILKLGVIVPRETKTNEEK